MSSVRADNKERKESEIMQKSPYRWMILFILVFGTAMLNFSNLIFASRPTDVMAQFNMTQAQLTAISVVGQLPGAFFSVVVGRMADKKGVRILPGVLLALAAACQIWRCFAADFVSLFIITFLAGALFLPTQVLQGKMLGVWFPREEMGTAMGIYGAAAGLGTTLAFAFGGMFPTIRAAFTLIAVGYVLEAVLWFAIAKMPAGLGEGPAPEMPKGNMGNVVKSKNMWLLMICGGLSVGAALLLNSYLINAFIAKGLDPSAASGIATLLNVCLLIGSVLSGIVVSKVGRYNIPYIVICVGGAVLYYLAYMLPISPLTYVLVAAGGIIVAGSIGVNMARIPLLPLTGEFGPEDVGVAGGMNNTAVGICAFVLPVLVSTFVGDNYTMIFTLMAIFLVIIAIIGGVVMPELGEKGKLAQRAKEVHK